MCFRCYHYRTWNVELQSRTRPTRNPIAVAITHSWLWFRFRFRSQISNPNYNNNLTLAIVISMSFSAITTMHSQARHRHHNSNYNRNRRSLISMTCLISAHDPHHNHNHTFEIMNLIWRSTSKQPKPQGISWVVEDLELPGPLGLAGLRDHGMGDWTCVHPPWGQHFQCMLAIY
jgi:hypothetical protein